MKIDSLTQEQIAAMPGWRDKWLRIGLSTDRADRTKFEAAVSACYRSAGLAPPTRVVWVASPYVLWLACKAQPASTSVRDAVEDAVEISVRESVCSAVEGTVAETVARSVGSAARDAVREAVARAVRDAVGEDPDGVVRTVRPFYPPYLGGQFWAGGWWGSPAFVSYVTDICGLIIPEQISTAAEAYQSTCDSACWWVPYKSVVIVSERPIKILRDELGLLHSETGNAIEWPDGWGFASWHGKIR